MGRVDIMVELSLWGSREIRSCKRDAVAGKAAAKDDRAKGNKVRKSVTRVGV